MQINNLAPLRNLDMGLIKGLRNARQALSLCVRSSGHTDEYVAEQLHISKGYLSKILSGQAQLDGDRRIKLMHICGNRAPLQYEAWAMGIHTMERDPQELLREAMAMVAAKAGQ
jgi:transcriptional regulator with XRE-family HTH domain